MPEGDQATNGGPNEHTPLMQNIHENVHGALGRDPNEPLYKDSRPYIRYPAETAHITYEVLKSNYVNVLLVFVPLGIIGGALGWNPTAVFILNFFAIVPLASLLSFATEELSVPLGQTLGGLLNATFGNAVELIVSIKSWPRRLGRVLTRCVGQYHCSQE